MSGEKLDGGQSRYSTLETSVVYALSVVVANTNDTFFQRARRYLVVKLLEGGGFLGSWDLAFFL